MLNIKSDPQMLFNKCKHGQEKKRQTNKQQFTELDTENL